MNAYFIYLIKR